MHGRKCFSVYRAKHPKDHTGPGNPIYPSHSVIMYECGSVVLTHVRE